MRKTEAGISKSDSIKVNESVKNNRVRKIYLCMCILYALIFICLGNINKVIRNM